MCSATKFAHNKQSNQKKKMRKLPKTTTIPTNLSHFAKFHELHKKKEACMLAHNVMHQINAMNKTYLIHVG